MNKSDWIGLGIIAAVILLGLFGLSRVSLPYDVNSEEEFQRRKNESPGLMTAGLMGLQQVLDPSAKKAVEVQQDLRRGVYDDEEEPDDPPQAGAEARERNRNQT